MSVQKFLFQNKKIRIVLFATIFLWIWVFLEFLENQFVTGADITAAIEHIKAVGERTDVLMGAGSYSGSQKELTAKLEQIEQKLDLEQEADFCVYSKGENEYFVKLELEKKGEETFLYSLKDKLTTLAQEQGIKDWQSFFYTSYPIEGKLTQEEQKEMAEQIFRKLSAKQVFSCQVEGMQSFYGQSEQIREKIHTNGVDVNLQVAFSYEEEKQRTICYIGTPILNNEY